MKNSFLALIIIATQLTWAQARPMFIEDTPVGTRLSLVHNLFVLPNSSILQGLDSDPCFIFIPQLRSEGKTISYKDNYVLTKIEQVTESREVHEHLYFNKVDEDTWAFDLVCRIQSSSWMSFADFVTQIHLQFGILLSLPPVQ